MPRLINIKKVFLDHIKEIKEKVICAEVSNASNFRPPVCLKINYTDEEYQQFLGKIDVEVHIDSIDITIWFERSWSKWWGDENWSVEFSHYSIPIIPKGCIPPHMRRSKKFWI